MSAGTILWLLMLFQIKHLAADYLFQSGWMVRNKGRYGHPGGLLHAGVHGLCTVPVLLLAPVSMTVVAAVVVAEVVLHYHIDWSKVQIGRLLHLTPERQGYWIAMGADQFAHQVTYVLILAAVAGYAT